MRILSASVIFILCVQSCKPSAETGETKASFQSEHYNNRAFILSDSICIYNEGLTLQQTVHGVAGTLVHIDSISVKKHFPGTGDTACDVYNLVKVKSDKGSGWVYGKDVFEFTEKKKTRFINRDTNFMLDGIGFSIFVLKNFGLGSATEEGITYCGEHNPIALYNSKYKKLEVIPVTDTGKTYGHKFLSLDNSDGWLDAISSMRWDGNQLFLGIEREYQEGNAHFDIVLHLDPQLSSGVVSRARKIVKHD